MTKSGLRADVGPSEITVLEFFGALQETETEAPFDDLRYLVEDEGLQLRAGYKGTIGDVPAYDVTVAIIKASRAQNIKDENAMAEAEIDGKWVQYPLHGLYVKRSEVADIYKDLGEPSYPWITNHGDPTVHDRSGLSLMHLKESSKQPATKKNIKPQWKAHQLQVTVDNINDRVTVVYGGMEPEEYPRGHIVGKGSVTWDLLVDFAKYEGLLEGVAEPGVAKRNTSANRKNLGDKLIAAFNLSDSPIVEKRKGVMRIGSIGLKGGLKSIDALDRKRVDWVDQASEFLLRHGEEEPDLD